MKNSIALCTYNGSKYLIEQLESLKKQIVKADEIVVCDDCSTDNTIEILEKYKDILNIKIFKNDFPLGVTKNFEKAISLCSGDIIFLCDQDDIWESDKIKKMSATFKYDDVGITLCDGILIDENSKQIKKLSLWKVFNINDINKQFFKADFLICRNIFTGICLAFRANLRKYILPISEMSVHDEWIGIISSYKKKVCFLDEKLIRYRIHQKQKVGIGLNYLFSFSKLYNITKKYKISDVKKELDKTKDIIKRFEQLNADELFINKLRCKLILLEHRIRTDKFRLLVLFLQFITGNYKKYTDGNLKTFIKDVFTNFE